MTDIVKCPECRKPVLISDSHCDTCGARCWKSDYDSTIDARDIVIDRLRTPLKTYGRHTEHCNSQLPNRGTDCTCGWVETSD